MPTVTLKDLKRLRSLVKEMKINLPNTKHQYEAQIMYHEAASEYWDNQVGSSLKYTDSDCTRLWEHHQYKRDKAWNSLKQLEEEATSHD